jgi:hypothetical protein
MGKQFTNYFENLALAIALWMCLLPLVGLLILPFVGLKISLLIAVGLRIVVLVICQRICS